MEKKKMRGEERGRKVEGPPTRVSRGVRNDSSRGTRTSLTETFFFTTCGLLCMCIRAAYVLLLASCGQRHAALTYYNYYVLWRE